jgi:hypothetical protein
LNPQGLTTLKTYFRFAFEIRAEIARLNKSNNARKPELGRLRRFQNGFQQIAIPSLCRRGTNFNRVK